MAKFEESRPKLKPCVTHIEGHRVVLEEKGTGRHYILPGEARCLVEKFDGTRTLREIVTCLHHEHAPLRFRTLLGTIEQLERAGFLELLGSTRTMAAQAKPGWRARLERMRDAGFRKVLVSQLSWGLRSPAVFYALAVAMVAASAVCLGFGGYGRLENSFLLVRNSYVQGLEAFVLAGFGLLSAKCLFQCALLAFSSGKLYGLSLRFSRLSLHFSVDDSSIYLMRGRTGPALFYLASMGCVFVFASVATMVFARSPWVADLKTLAVFFALLELNPYRPTDLQKLFYLFQRDDVAAHLVSYLKSQALFSFLTTREKIAGEGTMVVYAAFALGWSSGALYFVSSLMAASGGNLLLGLSAGAPAERAAASLIALGLAANWCYFWLDLLATLGKNMAYPLRSRVAGYKRKLRVRKSASAQIAHVKAVLRANPLFDGMDDDRLGELIRHAELKAFPDGTPLIIQGVENRELFAVVEGSVRVLRHEPSGAVSEVATLGPSSVIGEISVLEKQKATSDVVAKGMAVCVVIDREVVQKLGPASMLEKITLGHFIGASPIFRKLPKEILHRITQRGRLTRMGPGRVVFEEGSAGNALYLVVHGRVEVMHRGGKIKELGQGDFFGEIALIAQVPRSATIRTTTECAFLELDSEAFWEVLAENAQFSLFMESVADLRIRESALIEPAA